MPAHVSKFLKFHTNFTSQMSDEEEVIVGPSSDEDEEAIGANPSPSPGEYMESGDRFNSIVATYSALMWQAPAEVRGPGHVRFSLPVNYLPLSLQVVCGFTCHTRLLDVDLTLRGLSWTERPEITIEHPVLHQEYVGNLLVKDVVNSFFSPRYRPPRNFRAKQYLLRPDLVGSVNQRLVREIMGLGFTRDKVEDALSLSRNDKQKAIEFLKTGSTAGLDRNQAGELPDYSECPLLYFIMELAEVFLDLTDHCLACRKELTPGVKPSVCDQELCRVRMTQFRGVSSVMQEIKRDPLAADLVVSMYSAAALSQKWLNPQPPRVLMGYTTELMQNLPDMNTLVRQCRNDADLERIIGRGSCDLLRWILLSNRSHLIALPPELCMQQFNGCHQFMTLISTPEAELAFERLKGRNNRMFLFHGSHGDRWHSILRNGLKNATGTQMQCNGSSLGAGIYFARASSTSWGYSHMSPNGYARSVFGRNLHIISLCEVAKVPELRDHGWAHTLTNEAACIVRFLFVSQGRTQFQTDTISNPPNSIPTLNQILACEADKGLSRRR